MRRTTTSFPVDKTLIIKFGTDFDLQSLYLGVQYQIWKCLIMMFSEIH